jgi:serine/threonine protein kinase
MLDRLNAEITIHHQVKHPNIVELLNCFCDDKYVYLILEICANGDLEHYLQEKKTLSEHESMRNRSFFFVLEIKVRLFQLGISPNK